MMLTKTSSQLLRQRGIAFLILLWIDGHRSKLRVFEAFDGFRLFRGWLDGLNMFEPFEWQDGVFPWPWTFPGKVEVGIGSGALHASLDAVAQAGDELPMLQLGDPVPSRPTL